MVGQGMRLALTGIAIGILAAAGLTRFIAGFLFGVKAWDPIVFILVPILLIAVALLAVWLPALRASRDCRDHWRLRAGPLQMPLL